MFLPPANEVCKGYVFTGVCLSTVVGLHLGGLLAGGLHLGSGRTPRLKSDTMGYGQQAGGIHPTGMHSCLFCVSAEVGCQI